MMTDVFVHQISWSFLVVFLCRCFFLHRPQEVNDAEPQRWPSLETASISGNKQGVPVDVSVDVSRTTHWNIIIALCKKTMTVHQGLVNVPFWEYWTSPYSSHYRPYTIIYLMVGWCSMGTFNDPCSRYFTDLSLFCPLDASPHGPFSSGLLGLWSNVRPGIHRMKSMKILTKPCNAGNIYSVTYYYLGRNILGLLGIETFQ